MNATNAGDYKTTMATLKNRFGESTMYNLLDLYESNYWTEADFDNCKNIDENKCIKCCSCIKRCPFNSKEITHMAFKNMQNMLETNFAHIERNPEIFID